MSVSLSIVPGYPVLSLDEAPEFRSDVLEALRQPLEGGDIVIGRAERGSRFPARFILVMAANPCPCGRSYGKGASCECPPAARRRYRDRISGPIRDRIDLHRTVLPVTPAQMRDDLVHVESTRSIADRVLEARHRQRRRLADTPWRRNSEVPGPVLRREYAPADNSMASVDVLLRQGRLTARGADRVLRVTWTLADLAGLDTPGPLQVAEAVMLRTSGVLPRVRSVRGTDERVPPDPMERAS
jgi:magnesium chelatase family protein